MSSEIYTRIQRIVLHTNVPFNEVKEIFEKDLKTNPKLDPKRVLDRIFGKLLGHKHRKMQRLN